MHKYAALTHNFSNVSSYQVPSMRKHSDTLVPRAGFCWVTTIQIKHHAGLKWERSHLGLEENHPSIPRCYMCSVYYRVKINSLKSGHPDNLNFAVCAILRLITWTKFFKFLTEKLPTQNIFTDGGPYTRCHLTMWKSDIKWETWRQEEMFEKVAAFRPSIYHS